MSRVTQADVVREAIKQLRKKDGFVTDFFLKPKDPRLLYHHAQRPGDHVGATCAIGGVEQAIWKLTGKDVTADRVLAQATVPSKSVRNALYRGVITKLNAKTRNLYPLIEDDEDGEMVSVDTLERLTFRGSTPVAKRRVLKVFRAVLADLEG